MKRPKQLILKDVAGKPAVDDNGAWKDWPAIRHFLINTCYEDDGAERLPGVMIIGCRGQRWTVTMKEPSSCMMLKLVAATWDELCLAMEMCLTSEDAPWEHDAFEAARQPKKRRR